MSPRSLPSRPNLDQLKLQARELYRAHRDGSPSAAARIAAHHPEKKVETLADAQLVIAREYGFKNWAQLKRRVEMAHQIGELKPHPGFAAALAALDAGDVEHLRALVTTDPSLLHARTRLDPPYGYFTGATLLHHVAGNPYRDHPLPPNIVDLARVLLTAGADVHARTLGPNGGDTMGLLITGKQASDLGVTGPLMDLLLEHGADLDLSRDDIFDAPLANHSPAAAEKMIALGARPDVLVAAALGRLDLLRGFFDTKGRLLSLPRRHGKELSPRDAIGLAALYAYVRHQREAVDFLLEKDGNWNMTGVNNGTLLHRAAWDGDLETVARLVSLGADISNRDNPFHSTPMSWAQHNRQQQVFDWLRVHCAIDLHDAVCFDLREHVEARLREDPASINRQIDQWDVPQCAPLHWAAWIRIEDVDGLHTLDEAAREQLVRLLLDHGANPNIVAGNGVTPLDMADACGAIRIVALLEQRGAKRTTEAASSHHQSNIRQPATAAIPDPRFSIDAKQNKLEVRRPLVDSEWDEVIAILQEQQIEGLEASGQMTDAAIQRLAELDHITGLWLANSKQLTDAGLRVLARFPRLQHLELSGCAFTDRGLDVLRELPALKTFSLFWHRGVSDAALAHLTFCDQLERIDLLGTPVGDGVVNALTGKRKLRHLKTGTQVTDAGLPLLHRFPVFKTWHEGNCTFDLMSFDVDSNFVLLDGSFTDAGLETLTGLAGVFGVNLFWHANAFTPAGLEALGGLPNLGFFACHGERCDDRAMRQIALFPRLRMLLAQGTVATDAGFSALSRSQTIEYIWGRECPNLTGRGFAALAAMPELKGLAVSCKNVEAAALSTLPRFPALRELLPMDVSDEGFQYVGRCENLERLWCMYCRDTTDIATEHIAGLARLKTYYAGQTKITDKSLEILSRMPSLEKLEFWNCAGITNAGAARLAALPNVREIVFDRCRQITSDVRTAFPAQVRVNHSA